MSAHFNEKDTLTKPDQYRHYIKKTVLRVPKIMTSIRKLFRVSFLHRLNINTQVSVQLTFLEGHAFYLKGESQLILAFFAEKFCDCFHFLFFHYVVVLNYLFIKNGEGIALSNYRKKSLWKHQSYYHGFPIF